MSDHARPCSQSSQGGGDTPARQLAEKASPWVRRWLAELPERSEVLDVACGSGRHLALLATQGHEGTGIDRDVAAAKQSDLPGVTLIEADLEQGPWPLPGRQFAAVVVANYLWRPLFPTLLAAVAPGGLLVYETFMVGNEQYGRPRNPDFLLQPDELRLVVASEFEELEFAQGPEGDPVTAVRQRICARRPKAR
ncbi:MAG: class I SAM-dependent methyltransferase [Planctomycetota bacterium]|nr:class I SAM-dependent methyltransferase [Planctomycetota bacterium]